MNSLFDEKELYNEVSNELAQSVRDAIKPILTKWIEDNYKIREIEYVMLEEINMLCCENRLKKRFKKKEDC